MPKGKKPRRRIQRVTQRKCYFCESKKEPSFFDPTELSRFLSERGKIVPRSRSGLCTKHQKKITMAVKHARHLALLPFLSRA
ncbi:MAG TPA: 30S ribosomal protein S18 [Patescibacteria group bacterium]|nr:30S ribosomal protein S18 [Patescibacteria group bacterium]